MEQISLFDVEVKGIKSHWRWTGLYDKMCVNCGYIDNGEETPEFCPGCKSVMIQPQPFNWTDWCDSCKWDVNGYCDYEGSLRHCTLADAWERR